MWLDNDESVDPKLLYNNSHQTQTWYWCCWASTDGEVLASPAVDEDRTRPVGHDFPRKQSLLYWFDTDGCGTGWTFSLKKHCQSSTKILLENKWKRKPTVNWLINVHLETTTATILRPLHTSTCVRQQPQLRTEGFMEAKFYCPHACPCRQ